jgi:hypothetical protein
LVKIVQNVDHNIVPKIKCPFYLFSSKPRRPPPLFPLCLDDLEIEFKIECYKTTLRGPPVQGRVAGWFICIPNIPIWVYLGGPWSGKYGHFESRKIWQPWFRAERWCENSLYVEKNFKYQF